MRKKLGAPDFMQQLVKQDNNLCLLFKCSRFSDTVVIGVLKDTQLHSDPGCIHKNVGFKGGKKKSYLLLV